MDGLYFLKRIYFLKRKILHSIKSFLLRNIIIKRYLKKNKTRKLHLACGEIIIKGWLNADLYNGDIYLDATKKFPFPDNSFDYVYSHHFIEHISLDQFEFLLSEIYRILKKEGIIRLVTPDMDKLISIYQNNSSSKSKEIINFYCKDTKYNQPIEFLNQELRQYGEHVYIYNYDFLKFILEKNNFKDIKKYEYGNSDNKSFKNIDFHGYKMIDKISLCVEAKK